MPKIKTDMIHGKNGGIGIQISISQDKLSTRGERLQKERGFTVIEDNTSKGKQEGR